MSHSEARIRENGRFEWYLQQADETKDPTSPKPDEVHTLKLWELENADSLAAVKALTGLEDKHATTDVTPPSSKK